MVLKRCLEDFGTDLETRADNDSVTEMLEKYETLNDKQGWVSSLSLCFVMAERNFVCLFVCFFVFCLPK